MISALPHHGEASTLRDLLERRTESNPEFWNFADSGARSGGHALFQYPAMMVPEMQGALLDDAMAAQSNVALIYDPFVGSGTVLLESMYRGLAFHGTDINPMAILLSQVKAEPPSVDEAKTGGAEALARARGVSPDKLEFFGRDKWFTSEVLDALLRVRAAVRAEPDQRVRQFLWVCMAETVRLVSNSRTSTVKLHIYAPDVLESRKPDALRAFEDVVRANCRNIAKHWQRMQKRVATDSTSVTLLQGSVNSRWTSPRQADVIMTSPPYGDNDTTIPYGQHSYLPLQLIDPSDIPGGFDPTLLRSTREIDSRSLGGSKVAAEKSRAAIVEKSDAFGGFLDKIEGRPELEKKVLAFGRDYDEALNSAFSHLRPAGHSFLTLGERRVGGEVMPLVQITQELLEARGQRFVALVSRRVLRKRMAVRNSEGSTMSSETVLVMQNSLLRNPWPPLSNE